MVCLFYHNKNNIKTPISQHLCGEDVGKSSWMRLRGRNHSQALIALSCLSLILSLALVALRWNEEPSLRTSMCFPFAEHVAEHPRSSLGSGILDQTLTWRPYGGLTQNCLPFVRNPSSYPDLMMWFHWNAAGRAARYRINCIQL